MPRANETRTGRKAILDATDPNKPIVFKTASSEYKSNVRIFTPGSSLDKVLHESHLAEESSILSTCTICTYN
jgi:hypothetical protein